MKHILMKDLGQSIKNKKTYFLLIFSIILSVSTAFLVVSFESFVYINNTGIVSELSGFEAAKIEKENDSGPEGYVTSEFIESVIGQYRATWKEYDEKVPETAYVEKIYPINFISYKIASVYIDQETGERKFPAYIKPDESELFYDNWNQLMINKIDDYAKDEQLNDILNERVSKVDTPFYYSNFYGWNNGSDYLGILIFIIILMIVVYSAPCFATEYESSSQYILKTTKYGKRHLAISRIVSNILITSLIYWVSIILYLSILTYYFGIEGLESSVQLLEIDSISNISFKELLIYTVVSGHITALSLVSGSLFISACCNKTSTAIVASITVVLLPTFIGLIGQSNIVNIIKYSLPSGSIGIGNSILYSLTSLEYIQILNLYIWIPYYSVVIVAFEMVVFILLSICIYTNRS